MPQPVCNEIEEVIKRLEEDLMALDDQLNMLAIEGLKQLKPWRYFALQPKVDRLLIKKRALQDAWNRAMYEWAICRSARPMPHRP